MVNLTQVPEELRESPCWVLHKNKVPFRTDGKGTASHSDPHSWNSFENTLEVLSGGGYDGMGYVFWEGNGFSGVDFDRCLDPKTEKVTEAVWDIVQLLETYTEISCSGKGLHSYLRGKKQLGTRCHLGHAEVYDRNHYFVVTGNKFKDFPSLCADGSFYLDTIPLAQTEHHSVVFPETPSRHSDEFLLARACETNQKFRRLFSGDRSGYCHPDGTLDFSRSDMALLVQLAWWTNKNGRQMQRIFRQSKLHRPKFDRDGYSYSNLSCAKAIRFCKGGYGHRA